jgi:hypothetical protein
VLSKFEADPLYVNNYMLKLRQSLQFLSDRLAYTTGVFSFIAAGISLLMFYAAYRFFESRESNDLLAEAG